MTLPAGPVQPLVRLLDLTVPTVAPYTDQDAITAVSRNLSSFRIDWVTDGPGSLAFAVPIVDPGGGDAPQTMMSIAVGGSGSLSTGSYLYAAAYLYGGSVKGYTTLPGASPGRVFANAGQRAVLSSVPVGGAGVTKVLIYRTLAGGQQLYLLTTLTNGTTTFTDTLSDAALLAQGVVPVVYQSFATALLRGAGSDISISTQSGPNGEISCVCTITPTLAELSLDGGQNYDSRKFVESPHRVPDPAGGMAITEDGSDLWLLYSLIGPDKVTFTGCTIAAVLGAAVNTVLPATVTSPAATSADIGYISDSKKPPKPLPGIGGLLTQTPGPNWAGASRLAYTPCIDADIGLLVVNANIWSDYISSAVEEMAQRVSGHAIDLDPVRQVSRGHYVADSSDAALNITGTLPLYKALDLDRKSHDATYSAPSTNGTGGVSRSLTLCGLGLATAPALTFDGMSTGAVNETAVARIRGNSEIVSDMADIYGDASFIGGPSDAGLPGGYKVTQVKIINASQGQSGWDSNLPIFSVYVNDTAGGLYHTPGDGVFYLWSPPWGIFDFDIDSATGYLYVGTAHGVYRHRADPNDQSGWTLVGAATLSGTSVSYAGMVGRVIRVQVIAQGLLIVHVKGSGAETDGIYCAIDNPYAQVTINNAATSAPSSAGAVAGEVSGLGHDGWSRVVAGSSILDAVATDGHSCFYLDGTAPDQLVLYDWAPVSGSAPTTQVFPLSPDGSVKGQRLYRVTTILTGNTPPLDMVWVTTTGGAEPAYYFYYNTAIQKWVGPFSAGVSSIPAPDTGQKLVVYRVVGPGTTINGCIVSAMLCTNNGLFWTDTAFTTDQLPTVVWRSSNGQNGLSGVPVTSVATGAMQPILARNIQRLVAINDTQVFSSQSAGCWWLDLTRNKVTLGPFFSSLARAASGSFPDNSVERIGPGGVQYRYIDPTANTADQQSSAAGGVTDTPASLRTATAAPAGWGPPGLATTLTTPVTAPAGQGNPTAAQKTAQRAAGLLTASISTDKPQQAMSTVEQLMQGWYWTRVLDGHGDFAYHLTNVNSPVPHTKFAQLTEVQTNTLVSIETAAETLAQVTKTWLQQHSLAQVTLTLYSSFTQSNAALRTLRPGMMVLVNYSGTLYQRVNGAIVGTAVVSLVNAPLYVVKHSIEKSSGSGELLTTTEVSAVLRTRDLTPSDIAASFATDLKNLKTFGQR